MTQLAQRSRSPSPRNHCEVQPLRVITVGMAGRGKASRPDRQMTPTTSR
ncbi:hypothetical protein HMPREF9582_02218 [Cutibacterium acnes HL060PA1]|nr:hypothetical protein HMPREF9577_01559 [Cutibacterium acnes HL110PA3]EFT66708.1 hypothetical protein HMPREF9582_02218 [Cutibacterium acnes HL060PA1]